MRSSVISKKGWVVIPQSIRKRYKLEKGGRVNIIDYGNIISIIPLVDNPVEDSAGLLKEGTSLTDALISERKKDKEYGK